MNRHCNNLAALAGADLDILFRGVDLLSDSHIYNYSINNWASEASPTLGCSIEISRDIYMYICRYVSYVKLTA